MAVDPKKYVTFKREELFQHIGFSDTIKGKLNELELHDAVVIRKKDSVAAAGLMAYANTLVTVSEVMQETMHPDQAKWLLEVADYFAQQADESRQMRLRLPD